MGEYDLLKFFEKYVVNTGYRPLILILNVLLILNIFSLNKLTIFIVLCIFV